MTKAREYSFVYLFGALLYGLIEVIWRGHTHWTMALTGGAALLALYIINIKMSKINVFFKCLIGAITITALEFTVGVIINIILKWDVWDYSNRPLNILGQICPLFFFFWYLLCIPGFALCGFIRKRIVKRMSVAKSR